jgi:hypothetical protein
MTYRIDLLVVSSLLIFGACYQKVEDHGDVCVFTTTEPNGQNILRVRAQTDDAGWDYKGAYLKCTITVSGLEAHIETVFKDGKDPNDLAAAPLEGSCEVAVEPGDYTLDFDGEELFISVPGGEHVCFGYDFSTNDGAGTE